MARDNLLYGSLQYLSIEVAFNKHRTPGAIGRTLVGLLQQPETLLLR
jgi:hypothetical protein